MKKNKMMRLASCLLVAILLTTSVISGTFAKYTTSANSSDSARVAKWGFSTDNVSLDLTNLFKDAYDQNVKGATDVIAPGTTNSATFGFTYDGDATVTAPEVAYTFTVSTAGSTCATDIKNNANIQWKLDTGAWGTWDQLLASIEALDGDKAQYNAGELPTGFKMGDTHTVSWQWVFNTGDDADVVDTAMGNKTAEQLDKVDLHITVTATQVD